MNASSSVDPQRKWTDATIRYYKLIYRRHISRLLSPGGRRAGVTEAFNLSLSADGYTTPARPALPIPIPNVIYVNGNETETEKFDTETDKFGYVRFRFRCISNSRHHAGFM